MGSGELWRLRAVDPGYFEILYTQLIRHVSEGRLLRGSSYGRLLVERDRYFVGDTVVVRAQLSTASREPYVAKSVTARVHQPAPAAGSLAAPGRRRCGRCRAKPQCRAGGRRDAAGELYRAVHRLIGGTVSHRAARARRARRCAGEANRGDGPRFGVRRHAPQRSAAGGAGQRTGGRYYESPDLAVRGASGLPRVADCCPAARKPKCASASPTKGSPSASTARCWASSAAPCAWNGCCGGC